MGKKRFEYISFAWVSLLAGCATGVPQALRFTPPDAINLPMAVHDADTYRERQVRWGGTIVEIKNQSHATTLEILSRPLTKSTRPDLQGQSEGRFIVQYAGFLDPAIYDQNREVTVVGQLDGVTSRLIGDYHYNFPIVRATTVYVWPIRQERANEDPYYYDPWWPPMWYPWGYPYYYPFPYYRPPYWPY